MCQKPDCIKKAEELKKKQVENKEQNIVLKKHIGKANELVDKNGNIYVVKIG